MKTMHWQKRIRYEYLKVKAKYSKTGGFKKKFNHIRRGKIAI